MNLEYAYAEVCEGEEISASDSLVSSKGMLTHQCRSVVRPSDCEYCHSEGPRLPLRLKNRSSHCDFEGRGQFGASTRAYVGLVSLTLRLPSSNSPLSSLLLERRARLRPLAILDDSKLLPFLAKSLRSSYSPSSSFVLMLMYVMSGRWE